MRSICAATYMFESKLMGSVPELLCYFFIAISALVSRTFCDKCIVFLQTKVQAHRMHIILGLLGVSVGELHGNLSQAQVRM